MKVGLCLSCYYVQFQSKFSYFHLDKCVCWNESTSLVLQQVVFSGSAPIWQWQELLRFRHYPSASVWCEALPQLHLSKPTWLLVRVFGSVFLSLHPAWSFITSLCIKMCIHFPLKSKQQKDDVFSPAPLPLWARWCLRLFARPFISCL